MRFTLFYRGLLHSATTGNPRREEKHKLRRYFHKQLADLWETHPALTYQNNPNFTLIEEWRQLLPEFQIQNHPAAFIHAHDIGQFRLVPFVTRHLFLRCELDILFLRHEPAGSIFDSNNGDLDNRLKVLFDALKMPKDTKELGNTDPPLDSERPLFCLLEDDKLITRFHVETDRLLDRQSEKEAEVELVIRVVVRTTKMTYHNVGLGGD